MTAQGARANIALLIAAQILAQTTSIALVATSALVSFELASDKGLATLPIAISMVAGAALMMPASLFMQRYGRRAGFMLGAFGGVLCGLCAVLALRQHSLLLFLLASALLGSYQSFAQFYRFAAIESVALAQRARALSWVVSGGIVSAFTGPALARLGGASGLESFQKIFLILAVLAVVAMLLLSQLRLPLPARATGGATPRPLGELITQPVFLTALAASTAGFGMMSSTMSATPLAMQLCGLSRSASASVIQWHMLGMFVPSLFVGELVRRFGPQRVIASGAVLMLGSVAVATRGQLQWQFYVALTLLGVAWNFLFVGGSSLLTEAWRPGEQARVQASHDLTVFAVASVGSFFSGRLLTSIGWNSVNVFTLPLLLLAVVMMISYSRRKAVS
jgi:MFS family permease